MRSRSPYPPLTPQTPDNALQGLRFTRFDLTQNHSMILQSEKPQDKQTNTQNSKICGVASGAFSKFWGRARSKGLRLQSCRSPPKFTKSLWIPKVEFLKEE